MSWTQGEVKHTSNGSKVTETTLEMMGQMEKTSEGAQNENADSIKLKVPKKYKLQGARSAVMTQKIAYDWITQLKELKPIMGKKIEGHNGCPEGIRITQTYRTKIVERPKILQDKEEDWQLALQ